MSKLGLHALMIFVLIFASLMFSSCSEESIDFATDHYVFEDISKLPKDDIFIDIIGSSARVIDRISDIEKAKELTTKNYLLSKNELNELSKSLGFISLDEYKEYLTTYNKKITTINVKYNLESYDIEVIANLVIESSNDELQSNGNNCERIRTNCIASAGAAAMLGHIGCAALDATVVLGLICHGSVLVMQYAASDTCNANSEDCVVAQQ